MTKQTPSRRYTSLSQLGEAMGSTPGEIAAQDRADAIREEIANDTTSDSFNAAFGDVGAWSIMGPGEIAQQLDMPEPAEARICLSCGSCEGMEDTECYAFSPSGNIPVNSPCPVDSSTARHSPERMSSLRRFLVTRSSGIWT